MTTATTPTITVGWRLRMARERVGLQQRELAAIIGVHHNTVGNYERDKGSKKLNVLAKWADATGVDLNWIIGEADRTTARKTGVPSPRDFGRPWTQAGHTHLLAA